MMKTEKKPTVFQVLICVEYFFFFLTLDDEEQQDPSVCDFYRHDSVPELFKDFELVCRVRCS